MFAMEHLAAVDVENLLERLIARLGIEIQRLVYLFALPIVRNSIARPSNDHVFNERLQASVTRSLGLNAESLRQ